MNRPKYLVRFWSDELDTPQNVAEFWELDDAEGFCEEQNVSPLRHPIIGGQLFNH